MNSKTLLTAIGLAVATSAAPVAMAGQDSALNAQLQQLRLATAAFHSLDNAIAAGWTEQLTPCLSSPEGGMGYHQVNWNIFFDAEVDATTPELLVYAPTNTGGKRLVAVEYLVFANALGSNPVPELFGQTFHYNPAVDAWVLHVWLWQGNRNGLFADWNPSISCD
ncbi:hypothetical protein [Lysobacter solisilvae (ex Woo and Kim 2020)]|uniref:Uncharacterized protein n=1 Tax=Agrilutibacter terrestris TaxID=2865112 RepID=A0A7H0G074_9GAMM|nr:hypothetical protein [Lysobacter terrestris]QNP41690.1 hypothetical protein H8B22_05645 [Lysobacter terrestris]